VNGRLLGLGAAAAVLGVAGAVVAAARPRGRVPAGERPSVADPADLLAHVEGQRSSVTSSDGTRIAVEAFGPIDAPQVVLAHGWTNTGRVWQEVVALVGDRLRLVTFDQPGHGRSHEPPDRRYTLDVHGDALRAVVEQATGPGPLVLAGHSLGGMTVLNLARRHPDLVADRVVGVLLASTMSRVPVPVDGAARLVDRVAQLSRWALDRGGRGLVRELAGRTEGATRRFTHLVALGPGADPAHVAATTQLFREADPDVLAGLTLPILQLDEEAVLARLHVPTTVVVGDADRLTPPAYGWHLARVLPDARLLVLPGVGHMTPLEAAAVVAVELLELADAPAVAT